MIRKLKKGSLEVQEVFPAVKIGLELSERQSTATITVGPGAPGVTVGDWLMDEDEPGNGIVWRVRSVETDYGTENRTIQCEHMINSLRDRVMFGEVKAADMAGKKNAKTCTAKQAIEYILGKQSDWELDYIGYTKSAEYAFNGDDLYSAMETVSSSLESCWWTYDMSRYPFGIAIRQQGTDVNCEMRTDRNIRSMKKSIDKSRMYTRFYPIGKNNLKLGGNGYVQKNTGAYGVISKVETDQSKETAAQLQEWAEERLRVHAEPSVTITISGEDLSRATGEPMDRMNLGSLCRVPLPEFGTVITERVVKMQWSDKIANPHTVTITLANIQEDVATIISRMAKSGGGGGRAAAKKAEEDYTHFLDNDRAIGMVIEKDGEGGMKIRAAQICLAINQDGSTQAVIEASKIHLLGETIANTITANYIKTAVESVNTLQVKSLGVTGQTILSGPLFGSRIEADAVICSNADLMDGVNGVQVSGPSNNVYTLQYKTFKNGAWQNAGNFSRAVSSWDAAWSGGICTITASPQEQHTTVILSQGQETWDGLTVTIPINAQDASHTGARGTGFSAEATLEQTWSYGAVAQRSTPVTAAHTYYVSKGYDYYSFDVTVNGQSRKIQVNSQ